MAQVTATTSTTNTTQQRIAAADIVFVIAEASTGKTFTGDYLDVIHGFTHVDGDGPCKNMHKSQKYKEMIGKIIQSVSCYLMKDEDGPDELWMPLYEELVSQTLEAAKHSDKVVLPHACPRKKMRDFVMKRLKEGGAKDPTLLFLTIDENIKYESMYYRSKHMFEAGGGMTLEDSLKMKGWDGDGKITIPEYKEFVKKTNSILCMPFHDAPANAKIVDVSGRDVSHLDGIDETLGLTRSHTDLTYEEIRDKVIPIDKQRDIEFASNNNLAKLVEQTKEAQQQR